VGLGEEKKEEKRRNHRMKIYMACPITEGGHKLEALGVHFCRRKFENIFNHFYTVRPNATDFAKITKITPLCRDE